MMSIVQSLSRIWSQLAGEESVAEIFDLARIGGGAAGSDPESIHDSVMRHYEQRISAGWLEPPPHITDLRVPLSALTERQLVDRAEAVLRYELHPSGIRPRVDGRGRIDWAHNCADSAEWLFMLNRHAWWPLLGKAYRVSGDERYARAFVSQLTDWIDRCPIITRRNEKHPHWRLMEAALRMRISWLPSFGLFFDSPSFSSECKLRFLRSVFDHACFLERFHTVRNHLLRESNGLLCVALWLPELHRAPRWRQLALQRLQKELGEQINADGSQIELSTGYQWLAIDELEVTLGLVSRDATSSFRDELTEAMGSMYEFLAFLLRPDGTFASVNDGVLLWSRDRLVEGGKKLGRPSVEYIGSLGDSGAEPEETSRLFANAGLCVMRDEWSPKANWLLFDAGPYGGPHGHEDKLSIEVTALGRPMIVDTGFYTYQKGDPYRDYFVSSHAHSTVTVDGLSQIRRWQPNHRKPAVYPPAEIVWRTDRHFDYARGRYTDGYGRVSALRKASGPVAVAGTHERHVLFVKPDYWCLFDELRIEGDAEHSFEQSFQVAPGIEVRVEDEGIRLSGGEQELFIMPVGGAVARVSRHTGEDDPPRGWYSPEHFQKLPATTISITRIGTREMAFATLLCPLRAGEGAPQVVSNPGAALAFVVETRAGSDRFVYGPEADAHGSCRRKLSWERVGGEELHPRFEQELAR